MLSLARCTTKMWDTQGEVFVLSVFSSKKQPPKTAVQKNAYSEYIMTFFFFFKWKKKTIPLQFMVSYVPVLLILDTASYIDFLQTLTKQIKIAPGPSFPPPPTSPATTTHTLFRFCFGQLPCLKPALIETVFVIYVHSEHLVLSGWYDRLYS